jgi:hypothetical protein
MLVMPSVTFSPVSLNDKTGAFKTTATVSRPAPAFVEAEPAASEPEPPQALNKKVVAINIAGQVGKKILHNIQVNPFLNTTQGPIAK